MDFSPRPSRTHILCFGGPGRPGSSVSHALRARFAGSHLIEVLHDPGDVTGVIRTLQRAGRRRGDEVEVIVADSGVADAADASLLRANWPAACWVFLEEDGPESPGDSAAVDQLGERVSTAIGEYRRRRRADLNAALARMELLRSLPADRLAWIADRVELRRYEAGEVVMKAGEPGDGVYFIRSGEVRILGAEVKGEHVIVGRGRGEHVGELALITGEPRSNTVVTALDSEVFFLRKEHYNHLMRAEPGLSVHLSRVLGTRLAHAHRPHRETPRIIALARALPDHAIRGAGRSLAEAIAAEAERAVILIELEATTEGATGDTLDRAIGRLDEGGGVLSREDCEALGPGLWGLAAQRPETLRHVERPGVLPGLLDLLTVAFDFVVVAVGARTPRELMVRVAKQCDVFLLHVGNGRDYIRQASELLQQVHRDCPSPSRRSRWRLRRCPGRQRLRKRERVSRLGSIGRCSFDCQRCRKEGSTHAHIIGWPGASSGSRWDWPWAVAERGPRRIWVCFRSSSRRTFRST